MKKELLQMFAEEGGETSKPDTKTEGTENKEETKEQEEPEAKYTDEDVDRIVEKKFAKWKKTHEKEVSEAKKLAEMDAKEKAEYERDKLQKELDDLRNEKNIAEMSKTARKMLSEDNINVSDDLLSMLVSADAEETKTAVTDFKNLFKNAVQDAVKEALKGNPPKTGTPATITKEQIEAVKDRKERQALIKENMHLFKGEK